MPGGCANPYGCAGSDQVNNSDPFGLCKDPASRQKGMVGICIETFIAGASAGVPGAVADNRGPSSSGGSFKTSDRFAVNPRTGAVLDEAQPNGGVGSTAGVPGAGFVGHSKVSSSAEGTTIAAGADARTMSPYPPGNIDYNVNLQVSPTGDVKLLPGGSSDGFPSMEIWVYRDGQAPQLLYSKKEGNVMQLMGCCDTKVPDKK